jgi:hypothetical protein
MNISKVIKLANRFEIKLAQSSQPSPLVEQIKQAAQQLSGYSSYYCGQVISQKANVPPSKLPNIIKGYIEDILEASNASLINKTSLNYKISALINVLKGNKQNIKVPLVLSSMGEEYVSKDVRMGPIENLQRLVASLPGGAVAAPRPTQSPAAPSKMTDRQAEEVKKQLANISKNKIPTA